VKKTVLIVIALLLSGCAGAVFTPVDTAGVRVRECMEVQAGGDWNRFTPTGVKHREIWTQHGVTLDQLVFFAGVADGVPLDDLSPRERKAPAFKATMSPEDVVALVETMLAGNGGHFELGTLAPARVSDAPGFRFDFGYIGHNDEVERSGTAVGAIVDGRLYLMIYVAPRGHYYDLGQPGAARLMNSLRIIPAHAK